MTNETMERRGVPPDDPSGGGRGTLRVTVRYAAAPKPFEDDESERTETVGALKARVLNKFGLAEGAAAGTDGSTIHYKLYHGKDELTDPSRAVGDVAGPAQALQLKLSQFIQQGNGAREGRAP